jgi:cytochrome P450 family 6
MHYADMSVISCFQDRERKSVDEKSETLDAHLLNLTGTKWKILRSKLTPTFTSGKIKMMFNLMAECADQLKRYLDKPARNGEMVEMKEVMAKFTTDVIGSCAFGLQCNSMTDSDSEFRKMGKQVFATSFGAILPRMLVTFCPFLLKLIHIRMLPKDVSNFFMEAVKVVTDYRKKNSVVRNDFINLLIELKNKGTIHDDEDIKSEYVQDETACKETEETIGEHTACSSLVYNVTV